MPTTWTPRSIQRHQPGVYLSNASAQGFSPAESHVAVLVNTTRDVSVTLTPARLEQSVQVNASASSIATAPVDAAATQLGGIVYQRDLSTIPLAERSFANVAYLVPGTEPVEPSDPTKARITAVSFGVPLGFLLAPPNPGLLAPNQIPFHQFPVLVGFGGACHVYRRSNPFPEFLHS